jgi:hypothetical protein
MAQVWSHPITPLLSPADRRTQILWGLYDFERRFGRAAKGMWLPETAADPATLETLIELGVEYTIVAPEQIAAVRPPGGAWTPVDRDTVDTGRAYRWMHGDGSGRHIDLCVFDGPLSRELAFGAATRDAGSFVSHVQAAAARSKSDGLRLVLAASDGELYGHHKKFADLTLAYALSIEAAAHDVHVLNLEAYLAREPATWEAELARGPHGEGTAWSCSHGLGRWRRHCGCAMRPESESGWRQDWRGPLRDALDLLRDRAVEFFEDAGADLFLDPWGARDLYGVVLDAPVDARRAFLREAGRNGLAAGNPEAVARALGLMELQRALLAMYASCGWFFDDIGGLEAGIVLRQAACAIDLWRTLGGAPPEKEFEAVLAQAHSNVPALGNGADVYRRVAHDRFTPACAATQAALGVLLDGVEDREDVQVPGFRVVVEGERDRDGDARTFRGAATVRHERTGEERRFSIAASDDGHGRLECRVEGDGEARTYGLDDLPEDSREPLVIEALERLAAAPRARLEICRSALRLAKPADVATPLRPWVASLYARLLERLLHDLPDGDVSEGEADVILELLDRAKAAPEGGNTERTAQEWLWGRMVAHGGRKRLPEPVRRLAERLNYSPELATRGHEELA